MPTRWPIRCSASPRGWAALLEKLRLAEVEFGRAPSSERVPSVFGFTDARRMLDAAAA